MAGASRQRKVPEQAKAHDEERERPEGAEGPEEEAEHPEITLSGIAREAKMRRRMRIQKGLEEMRQSLEESEQRRIRKGKAVAPEGTTSDREGSSQMERGEGDVRSMPRKTSKELEMEVEYLRKQWEKAQKELKENKRKLPS